MTDKKLPGPTGPDGDEGVAAFSEALAAALRPSDIDPDVHEAILARALGLAGGLDAEGAPASEPAADEAEQARSALLASVLEGRVETTDPGMLRLVQLARALRLAYAPTAIDEVTHQRLLSQGLKTPTRTAARRTVMGAVFVLVAAAAVIFGLYVQGRGGGAPTTASNTPRAPMIEARSTVDLFDAMKPFDREKGTTERVDKITTTREQELRDNRFNAWGVP